MHILEVDQWTSTGNIMSIPWTELQTQGVDAVSGGDSEAARLVFGGRLHFYEVDDDAEPQIGNVWYIEDDGYPAVWKYRYDSSG
jgi:hypothetical protein